MRRFAWAVCVVLAGCSMAAAVEFHVAVDGKDSNPGTEGKPFASISQARDALRPLIARGLSKQATVIVHGGNYFLTEPLVFDSQDSGTEKVPVLYKAAPGETPVVYGGPRITGWKKFKDNIYRAPVPKDKRFFQLSAGVRAEPMARHPNKGSGYLRGRGRGKDAYQIGGLLTKDDDLSDAQMHVWLKSNWFAEVKEVKSFDGTTFKLHPAAGFEALGNRAYIQGVLKFLDEPGEWCLKHKEGMVYYWPRGVKSIDKEVIVAPVSPRTIQFLGKDAKTPVEHIVLEGLTFIGSDFIPFIGIAKSPQGVIYMTNARGIHIERCRILNAGCNGVMMHGWCRNNTVTGCWIERCGVAGVFIGGPWFGDKTYKTAAESYINKGHRITNNFIHDLGMNLGQGCGIQFSASGDNVIEHNRIARAPRYGISYKGMIQGQLKKWGKCWGENPGTMDGYFAVNHTRNNTIRFNDISNVCRDSHDFGGIESWGVGRDNLWEYNTVHDVDQTVGWGGWGNFLYPDDGSHYVTIRGNIVHHCFSGAIGAAVMLKSIGNVFENNVVADCSSGRTIILYWYLEPCGELRVNRNIIVGQSDIYTYGRRGPQIVKEMDNNVYWPHDGNMAKRRGIGWDKNSVKADPLLDRKGPAWNATHLDYTVKPASPALKLGFKQIPVDKIGLLPEFQWERAALFRVGAGEKIQGENYDRLIGGRTEGGTCIFGMGAGSWARYRNIDFGTGGFKTFKAAGNLPAGLTIEVRLDTPDGDLVATLTADGKTPATAPLKPVTGAHMLYLVFSGGCNLDWFTFE